MLGELANISWLTAGQLEKLAGALTVTRHEKRSTIFSDKSLLRIRLHFAFRGCSHYMR